MRQRLFKLGAFALFGAIVNVGVAWGICIASPWYEWTKPLEKTRCGWCSFEVGELYWKGELERRRGKVKVCLHTAPSCGNANDYRLYLSMEEWNACIPSWFAVNDHQRVGTALSNQPEGPHVWQWEESAAGWPAMSVHSTTLLDFDFEATDKAGWNSPMVYRYRDSRGVLVVPRSIRMPNVENRLPWAPVWPGFAINTIFYAAVLWLLFAAPFALRRRIRARRGQCPACAYPVGASDVCTECGRRLK